MARWTREARLRASCAHLYPYLEPGTWASARVVADRVIAWTLGRPDARFVNYERALDPEHFEFREADPTVAPRGTDARTRRTDD